MKVYEKHTAITLPYSAPTVFDFFADAANLQVLTPPWLDFRITTPTPIEMYVGRTINYRLKVHGVPIRWRTLISRWDPPHVFVDECVRGPYRLWRHEHTFTPVAGGTRVADHVTYALPLGPLGYLAHGLFVKRDVDRIFAYRQARLLERFPAERPGRPAERDHPARAGSATPAARAGDRMTPVGTIQTS